MKRILSIAADLLLLYATVSILLLVRKHLLEGDICPILLGVPACYWILGAVGIAWVGRLYKPLQSLFWVGCGFPWVLALAASAMQVSGRVECPKSASGVPMCFLSALLFTTILVLAFLSGMHGTRPLPVDKAAP